jgi:leucyl aminopeptidase
MKFSFSVSSIQKAKCDTAVLFFYQDKLRLQKSFAFANKSFAGKLTALSDSLDFLAKANDTAAIHLGKNSTARRLLLVGMGEWNKSTLETIRRAAAAAAKKARTLKSKTVAIEVPEFKQDNADSLTALIEGIALGLYKFDKYITKKEPEQAVEEITFSSPIASVKRIAPKVIAEATILTEATILARNLANAPANEIYPESLADAAEECAERNGFKCAVFEKEKIHELGMGGVLAVSQGSAKAPRFIVMEYGETNKSAKGKSSSGGKPIVLVGKGVTFDSGGISIKPAAGMAEMKMDMSGAAAVIGTFEAVSRLKLPVHLVGLIPAVENMLSGSAVKPGDIIRHYNGKTSEVDNTDAEGRLILADALGYAERFKPAAVIDLATLTGAVVVALGHVVTGMMGNDQGLMNQLREAGEKTYERVWELPLFDEYEKLIKSDVADVKNVGGRWAGAITAGWFLKKFIGDYKWVHLDIAGSAILEEKGDYTIRGGSGVGVRLLTEFLRRWK